MIRFGPAGNIKGGILESIPQLVQHKLTSMEVEFVRQVYMDNKQALEAGELAKKHGISLSVHASYYVNLSSLEKQKVKESRMRILSACERAHYLNASPVVFHAGFYQKRTEREVFEIIKEQILEMQDELKERGWKTQLAPETTGKTAQFGNLDELLKLSIETKCGICVDFSHLKARNAGAIDYDEVIVKLKRFPHIHCHFSGIEWGPNGERKHVLTKERDIMDLLIHLVKHKMDATIINESPDPLGDAVKMKKVYEQLKD